MHNGFFREQKEVNCPNEEVPVPCRKKGSRRPVLTVSEKLAIVHKAVVEQLIYRDISKEFRVTVQTVCRIVAKAKKKPEFIRDIFEKGDTAAAKAKAI